MLTWYYHSLWQKNIIFQNAYFCTAYTAQKMKFFSANVTHLLKKSLMKTFIFCAVLQPVSLLQINLRV